MENKKGTLPMGVEYSGKLHREFEIRPLRVKDTIALLDKYPKAKIDDRYAGLAVTAESIVSLGDIPKEQITPDLLLELYQEDFAALSAVRFP